MSSERSARRLVRCYPRAWRRRYGEELSDLIVSAAEGKPISWRARLDVCLGAGRERVRSLGFGDREPGPAQARRGLGAVLFAWALFLFAGAMVAKTSEHWQQALPAGGDTVATIAFGALVAFAVAAGVLVLAGIALSIPRLLAFILAGGWSQVRNDFGGAAALTAVLLLATAGLSAWAYRLGPLQRNGGNAGYGIAFGAWALLALATLLAWTAVAVRTASRLQLPARTLRVQAGLAVGVALAMVAMAAATGVWWIAVAERAPAALVGGQAAKASAAVPALIIAVSVMLIATATAGLGAGRAVKASRLLAR